MKKTMVIFGFSFLVLFSFCAQDKYADARKLTHDMVAYEEAYAQALGNAKSAADVIKAAHDFTENFGKIKQQIIEIRQKHPELSEEKKLPEDLKPMVRKSMQLLETIMKLMQAAGVIYAGDPNVQKAFEELEQKMQ